MVEDSLTQFNPSLYLYKSDWKTYETFYILIIFSKRISRQVLFTLLHTQKKNFKNKTGTTTFVMRAKGE